MSTPGRDPARLQETPVPLSEHEQRLLEQMEQQLLADDPRFATTMRDQRRGTGTGRRRTVVGIAAILLGLGCVVLSLVNSAIWLGVVAIVLMFAGLIVALTGPRGGGLGGPVGAVDAQGRPVRPGSGSRRGGSTRSRPSAGRPSGTFMQRLEQRWDRRRDER